MWTNRWTMRGVTRTDANQCPLTDPCLSHKAALHRLHTSSYSCSCGMSALLYEYTK